MAHDINHVFPLQEFTLSQFLQEYQGLSSREDEDPDKVKLESLDFVLTGRHPINNTQALINPLVNIIPRHINPTFRRDYDSLIGFTEQIPILLPIFVFPVPLFYLMIRKSIHIKIPFQLADGDVWPILSKIHLFSYILP